MPENVATRIPFLKLNSLIASLLLFVGHFALLGHAGQAGDGNAQEANDDAARMIMPRCRAAGLC